MSSEKTGKSAAGTTAKTPTSFWDAWLTPWLLGPALSGGFYLILAQLPPAASSVARAFRSNSAAYAATTLFFVGLAAVARKALGLFLDRRALRLVVIDADSLDGIHSAGERAVELQASTSLVPASIQHTKVVARIHEVCQYVTHCRSHLSLEEHLRYRADLAVEALNHSYVLVRAVIWGVPLAGVLGLVLGMVSMLHAVNPTDLDSSMPDILDGLQSAMSPLAVGLGLSLTLMFAKLIVERAEVQVLSQIEQFGILQVAPCFQFPEQTHHAAAPVVAPLGISGQVLEQSESLVAQQVALWQAALEDLRNRWIAAAREQQEKFMGSLQEGMAATVGSHVQQLDEARQEFLTGFRAVGLELSRVTAGLQQMGEEHQSAFHEQVTEVWSSLREAIQDDRQHHAGQMERLLAQFEKSTRLWHEDLMRATEAVTVRIQELQQQNEILQGVAEQEQALARLQDTLTHNLQSVRAIEAFEESIHSLNAAVHMLTIRAKAHAA